MAELFLNFHQFISVHSWWAVSASFLGGILGAVSPCILPLLPVTLGVISEASLSSGRKAIFVSLIFVLGVTVTYVSIGVTSAIAGIFLGNILNSFLVYLILGIICIFLGFSFFGVFHLAIFNINHKPAADLISVFILGLICGLSMIPCMFPILGAILTLISFKRNLLYAAACLGAFSLGYAAVFIFIGSSAQWLNKLSEKKHWVIGIKRFLGTVMILTGVYFFTNLFR